MILITAKVKMVKVKKAAKMVQVEVGDVAMSNWILVDRDCQVLHGEVIYLVVRVAKVSADRILLR